MGKAAHVAVRQSLSQDWDTIPANGRLCLRRLCSLTFSFYASRGGGSGRNSLDLVRHQEICGFSSFRSSCSSPVNHCAYICMPLFCCQDAEQVSSWSLVLVLPFLMIQIPLQNSDQFITLLIATDWSGSVEYGDRKRFVLTTPIVRYILAKILKGF